MERRLCLQTGKPWDACQAAGAATAARYEADPRNESVLSWLRGLIAHGYKIYCGFDADEAGDTAAAAMLRMHGSVHRLRPPAHDWNDALLAKS